MAVTILGQPTSPNVTGTSLVYSLSGSNQTQPQYRYITDVYESGSSTRLTRLFTNKNLSGNTNIDVAPILADYLDYDYNWKTTTIESSSIATKRFTIEFGEQYGTSLSSSVTNYTGSASSSIQVFLGNIQYPSVGNYVDTTNQITIATSSINFNNLPYGDESYSLSIEEYKNGDNTLTNNPNLLTSPVNSKYTTNEIMNLDGNIAERLYTSASKGFYVAQPIGQEDYATETYLNVFRPLGTYAYLFDFRLYDDNNNKIWHGAVEPTPSAPPASAETLTFGVGMQNLQGIENRTFLTASLGTGPLSASISSSNQWSWYSIQPTPPNKARINTYHFYYNEDKGPDTMFSADITGSFPYGSGDWLRPGLWANKYYPTYCNNEKTRFAFINSFGVWDYYNVYTPTRRVTNIDKQFYEIGNVKLNQSVTNYNVSNRGTTQYFTDYSDQFEITTETVDSQESQWLKELFTSPEVYIQSGSNFIPINILNTTETISNDTARNKNFQYTITYQYSNNREPR